MCQLDRTVEGTDCGSDECAPTCSWIVSMALAGGFLMRTLMLDRHLSPG